MRNEFGMEACMEAIEFDIEVLKDDPIRMLGEFILRAEQDVTFNKTMVEAMKQYIKENNIKWNNGRK